MGSRRLLGLVFYLSLLGFDADPFVPNVEPEPAEQAHVYIRDPDQRKARDHVATPIVVQHGEAGDKEYGDGDVMAEAVLAGEEKEEFSLPEPAALLALPHAPFPRLPEHLFMGHRPGDGRDRNGEQEQVDELGTDGHERLDQVVEGETP